MEDEQEEFKFIPNKKSIIFEGLTELSDSAANHTVEDKKTVVPPTAKFIGLFSFPDPEDKEVPEFATGYAVLNWAHDAEKDALTLNARTTQVQWENNLDSVGEYTTEQGICAPMDILLATLECVRKSFDFKTIFIEPKVPGKIYMW